MNDVCDWVSKFDPALFDWADALTLAGVVGGLVFAIWVTAGAVWDVLVFLFRRPLRKLKGKGAHVG